MIKHYCDKCKKEIEEKDKYKITIKTYKGALIDDDIELCGDCANTIDKFTFPILDTRNYEFQEELDKLREETEELIEAANKYNQNEVICIDEVIEESYDVIQVVVNILYRLGLLEFMSEGLEKHIKKLKARGWNFKGE
ncbi:hypothetical protein [uncultured Intestinibacter sp.]|jgi:hypothetical protein|uniref:hypothetical protein n=1 Tax=uncultured Intestinibacter sp. TaxID=1505659 RepID=UPI0027DBFF5C|nr:hypothetical protein [uncultured Intestinibacter sp.]